MRSVGGAAVAAMAFGAVVLGVAIAAASPARADILVNVSKSQQKLEVIVDGAEAFRWPVSTGRAGHATPTGKFTPHMMGRHWYSHEYGLTPMPYAVFFHRGYAVHGTMESYNLGHAASHGCVRLRPDNAAILYWLVRKHGMKNTRVVVMNGPLPKAPPAQPQPPQLPAPGVPVAEAAPAPVPAAAPVASEGEQRFAKVLALAEDEQAQQLSAKMHEEPAQAEPVEAEPAQAERAHATLHRARRERQADAAPRRRHAHVRLARDEGFMAFGRD